MSTKDRRAAEQLLANSELQHLNAEELVVLPLLCDLADRLRHALDMRIDVRVEVDRDCPSCVGDRLALEDALMNLIVNARDAMPNGGYLLLGGRACGLPDARLGVEISVSDSGTGMCADAMSRVGQPFITTGARGEPRVGMGLAATSGFVRQSGGVMSLHSPGSSGLTVALRLPQFLAVD